MRTRKLLRQLKKTQAFLKKFSKDLPNKDLYVTVHCIAADTIKTLEEVIKDIKPALKEARKEDKRKK